MESTDVCLLFQTHSTKQSHLIIHADIKFTKQLIRTHNKAREENAVIVKKIIKHHEQQY